MNDSARTRPELPSTGPLPGYLVQRHAAWKSGKFAESQSWYARLAEGGQHPRAMAISCCDSRIDTVQMFGAEPGDLFVVRNVANLIPPYSPDHQHHGTSAAVEYAVNALKVAHIVVIGHSNCGGVRACHDMCAGHAPELDDPTSFVGRWMDILRPGYNLLAEQGLPAAEMPAALEKEAVLTSLVNLGSFPFVAAAVAEGKLTLHGCFIDIATGALLVYDSEAGGFV